MSTSTMADLLAQAADAGFGGSLANGDYITTVKEVRSKANLSGQQEIGVLWQVVPGPNDTRTGSTWQNQTMATDNPQRLGFFFKLLRDLGLSDDIISQANPGDISPLAAYAAQSNQGVLFSVTVSTTQSTKNGKTYTNQNIKVNQRGVQAGPQAAAQSAPVPVPQPVPQPVVMQAPIPQPVVIQQAAPEVQYAPVAVPQAIVPQPAAALVLDPNTGLPPRPTGI